MIFWKDDMLAFTVQSTPRITSIGYDVMSWSDEKDICCTTSSISYLLVDSYIGSLSLSNFLQLFSTILTVNNLIYFFEG